MGPVFCIREGEYRGVVLWYLFLDALGDGGVCGVGYALAALVLRHVCFVDGGLFGFWVFGIEVEYCFQW